VQALGKGFVNHFFFCAAHFSAAFFYIHYRFMTQGLESPSTVIFSALGRAVVTVNGLNSSSIEGHSTAFSPSYERVYDQTTGNYGKKKMSGGNQEWCEYEKTCNHKPWDPTANSEEQ
jgi:hypothetical protein